MSEGRSQEILGPYKRNNDEHPAVDVPTNYEDYVNGKPPRATGSSYFESKPQFYSIIFLCNSCFSLFWISRAVWYMTGNIYAQEQNFRQSDVGCHRRCLMCFSCYAGSSSTSSERSAPDSLYADLASVSDRDLQVPEGLVKGEGPENGFEHEGRASPNHSSNVRDHLSSLKLHSSS
jgi:hypothetical protein